MPARDIKLGDMTLHFHGQYMSEHSDKEYETLRKAFLRLGEDYGKLQSDYDKLLDDYNRELESDSEDSILESPAKPMIPKDVADEMNEFETKVTNATADLSDTLIAKNHDYGNAFHESVQDFGNAVMAIRINDKAKRLKTLLKTDQQVKDESIEDTLRDLAGYAILSLIELEQQKQGKS